MTANHIIPDILRQKNLFPESPLVFHGGMFELETVDRLIAEVDGQINKGEYSVRLKKKAFNISVEILQNLYHYLTEGGFPNEYKEGLFTLYEEKRSVNIMSGNFLETSKISSLVSRITMVNEFSSNELKRLYRGVLDAGSISESGGAGLGFVDIARKSENMINYDFIEVDVTYSFFVIKVKINE